MSLLRTSRCRRIRPNGGENSGMGMADPGNMRTSTRFLFLGSGKTGASRIQQFHQLKILNCNNATERESAGDTREKSGDKYQVIEEPEAVDSEIYEMESGSLVQNAVAVILLGALGLSAANILAKIGVITIALVSVAVRYSIIGILIVVLVCLVV